MITNFNCFTGCNVLCVVSALVFTFLCTAFQIAAFNTVADFKDDVLKNENSGFEITSDNIAFLKNEIDYMCGFNYILPGGYFVFQESVYNSGKMKIVKIAPELYVTK